MKAIFINYKTEIEKHHPYPLHHNSWISSVSDKFSQTTSKLLNIKQAAIAQIHICFSRTDHH